MWKVFASNFIIHLVELLLGQLVMIADSWPFATPPLPLHPKLTQLSSANEKERKSNVQTPKGFEDIFLLAFYSK